MNSLVRTVVVILVLLFLAKWNGVTIESIGFYLSRSPKSKETTPDKEFDILCNDSCLLEKDPRGWTMDSFIRCYLRSEIAIHDNEGSFRLWNNPSYTIIQWSRDGYLNPRRVRAKSEYEGYSVAACFVIRPVKVIAHRDENSVRKSVDGNDLIVYVNIYANEYRVWMDGESEPDNNEWKKGQPELPEFMVTRDSAGQFTWTESPRSRRRDTRMERLNRI